jgi:EAL domain-containing protein (putative c-di-GMP-specific phosphodiesterase class I)
VRHGVFVDRLQLVITEIAFNGSAASATETMRELRDLGIHRAADDFRTDNSSFAAVDEFSINILKVARTLLIGIENSPETVAMIQALTVLADKLGITMVIEGVEKHSQVLRLQELSCECAQGFFFAKSISTLEFESMICRMPTIALQSSDMTLLPPVSAANC